MRIFRFTFILYGIFFCLAAVSNEAVCQELPSAPSSTQTQKKPVPSPPAEAPTTGSPNEPGKTPAATEPVAKPSTPPEPIAKPDNSPAPTAQSNSPEAQAAPPDDTATTIIHIVNEVNVIFTVTDKHGHYVKDLKRDDFKVIDDNKPAVELRSFHSETDLPLEVGLLVDASNSVRDRFKFEQEAAIEFLNQTVRPKI